MASAAPTPAELPSEEVLQKFEDYESIMSIIDTVTTSNVNDYEIEKLHQGLKTILNKYLEQPYLLDAHLSEIVKKLTEPVRSPDCPEDRLHACMLLLTLISKMRKHKAVIAHLPHELSDIEPVLQLLERFPADSASPRPTTYMLLLWLSVLAMVPFQLSRLDSGDGLKKPVSERILIIVKENLRNEGKANNASAFLAANFITRPDIRDLYMDEFISWLQETIDPTLFVKEGATINMLSCLARIFKLAKRETLSRHVASVKALLDDKNIMASENIAIRKLSMKLVQRIGLSFLPANLAPWRHLRTVKHLADNLTTDAPKTELAFPNVLEGENTVIPEDIEDVIDKLLQGLMDAGKEIRWSAAKGIARIASRLPKDLASELVFSVFSLFEKQDNDCSWHGGCLALAELGRRGTLLPEHLPHVMASVLRSLVFDEQWGSCSVGTMIRDAACYVAWMLGRTYDPCHIAPFVDTIATTLVSVALFDRQVNCRRSAAAAFQECVGRLGSFPHGIEIITLASYFSLGRASASFLEVSVQVAEFPEYRRALITHLVDRKAGHWDENIRHLASQALYMLTAKDPLFVRDVSLPKILSATKNSDLNTKHGALLSLAETVHALSTLAEANKEDISDWLGNSTSEAIKALAGALEEDKSFLGVGGDLMKGAFCFLIEKLSLAHFPIHGQWVLLEKWLSVIDSCLHRDVKTLRTPASSALFALLEEYYKEDEAACKRIVNKYVEGLTFPIEGVRCNIAQALGSLPRYIYSQNLSLVMEGLIGCAISTDAECSDSRREAMLSLSKLCITLGVQKDGIGQAEIERLMSVLIGGMEDYTQTPKKGDAGANVRAACMTAFKDLVCFLASVAPGMVPEMQMFDMMSAISQQSVEPVDGVRTVATQAFVKILYNEPEVPHIPHREEVQRILPEDIEMRVSISHARHTFPFWGLLLSLDAYRKPILKGLLVSTGSMSEATIFSGKEALTTYLFSICGDEIQNNSVYSFLLELFNDSSFTKRALLKYLKALDRLATSGAFRGAPPSFPYQLQNIVALRVLRSKSVLSLEAAVAVLCSLLQFEGKCRTEILEKLLKLFSHRFPRVRLATAARIDEALLLYSILKDDAKMEEASTLLCETDFTRGKAYLQPVVERLSALFQTNNI